MFFCGSIVLVIATIMNLRTTIAFRSIIPYTKYVEAFFNSLCAILCLVLVFNPKLKKLEYAVFALQATLTTLIGFAGIGTMLLMFLVLSLFTDGFFKTKFKLKVSVMAVWWALVLIGVYPAFKLRAFLFAIALTFFYITMMLVTYDKLRDKLSYLLPKNQITSNIEKLPPPGSELVLSDYGLTKRQIKFLMLCINEGMTYEEISQANYISVSVVKKEMSTCCKTFGVKNREALRVLLLQYKLLL